MKKTKLTRSLLAACSIVALTAVMYGCSSSGEDAANMRADDADSALAALQEAYGDAELTAAALTALIAERDGAQADVTRLMGELTTANGNVERLTGELATANTDLTTANGNVERLTGELTTANGNVERLTGELATANTDLATATARAEAAEMMANAFATAQNARDDATGAATEAEEAVKAATAASVKITTLPAVGDSAAAEANAQAVLTARDDANKAVKTAQTALDGAKEALAAVDADAKNSDSLTKALEAAIVVAEAQLGKAKEKAEGTALKAAVELVTGDDPDVEGYPMTPAQHGRAVAMDIDAALSPTSETNGARARGTHGATAPADTFEDAVTMNDHQGSTWEEVVGAANVNDMRIDRGDGTKVVKAASFARMAVDSITTSPPAVGDEVTDGTEYDTANYMGIPGTVFCAGTDCKVEDVDGVVTLTGSWYFTPTDGKEWYVGTTVAGVTTYAAETLYARFGHWLAESVGNNVVNTYAMTGGNTSGIDLTTVNTGEGATTLTDTSASYRGPAAGMSVHQTTNADGEITEIDSAAFTATVNLKATFGDGATIAGTVNDFQGDATDSSWSVELQSTSFDGTLTNGRTVASGRDGVWTADAYGEDGERPTGIFGGFNAHFTDGHAAGAYAAR